MDIINHAEVNCICECNPVHFWLWLDWLSLSASLSLNIEIQYMLLGTMEREILCKHHLKKVFKSLSRCPHVPSVEIGVLNQEFPGGCVYLRFTIYFPQWGDYLFGNNIFYSIVSGSLVNLALYSLLTYQVSHRFAIISKAVIYSHHRFEMRYESSISAVRLLQIPRFPVCTFKMENSFMLWTVLYCKSEVLGWKCMRHLV